MGSMNRRELFKSLAMLAPIGGATVTRQPEPFRDTWTGERITAERVVDMVCEHVRTNRNDAFTRLRAALEK